MSDCRCISVLGAGTMFRTRRYNVMEARKFKEMRHAPRIDIEFIRR